MGRVLALADRTVDETAPCPPEDAGAVGGRTVNRRPYRSLIPLPELLGELLGTGAASKKTAAVYGALIEKAGSEFALLLDMDAAALSRLRSPGLPGELLAAALKRVRSGEVSITPGYDGEYGVVRAFPPGGAELSGGFPEFGRMPPQPKREEGGTDGRPQTRKPAGAGPAAERKPAARNAVPALPLAFAPDQAAAVSYDGKHAVIIAGPGTGKTAVLTARIERLIREGRDPASILALSFTVKAAGELRERIARAVSAEAAAGITAATFHSLCCALLREQPPGRGIPKNFEVLSEAGRNAVLEDILRAASGKAAPRYRRLGKYIEGRKRFLLLPGETKPALGNAPRELAELAESFGMGEADADAELLYGRYRARLKEDALLDYDDLVAGAARLLAGNPAVLAKYRARYRCILVDEYQDVNFAQYVLIRLLAPGGEAAPDVPELRVIGDPNQAIYAFRGSDKRFLDCFERDYPGAARFFLSRSFRCAAPIIKAAGRLTSALLEGAAGEGTLVRTEYPTEKSEAEGIARHIARLVGGTSFFALDSRAAGDAAGEGSASLGECVVLVRTAALAAPVVKALKDHGLPYEAPGDAPWWEEEPVKTVLERMRASPRLTGLPAAAARAAWEDAAGDGAPFERLLLLAGMYGSAGEFLDALAVSGSADAGPAGAPARDAVRVMTIHASKGLEADYVFAAGLEDGILPFTLYDGKDAAGPDRIAEEERLLYVAMTRARRGLYLSWARSRVLGNRRLEAAPSRFLRKLETLVPLTHETRKRGDPQARLL
jgi:superfamily I DNA/RNA helicase